MRKTKLFLLLLLFSARLWAVESSTLVVNLRDGTSANFSLSDKPRITFSGTSMNISAGKVVAEFVRSEVRNYLFSGDVTRVQDAVADEAGFSIGDNIVTMSSLSVDAAVRVYSADGRCVSVLHADSNGQCTLSFGNLPSGIYIITYNNTSIKYLKK